jgi:phage/plasmid-associated DNA primase
MDQGAYVLVEVLPNGLDGTRLGLDDLISRHGSAVFLEIAQIARHPFKIYRKKDKEVRVWAFNPEPIDTRERNVYLFGLHGHHWRRSADAKDHWQHWCGSHWEAMPGDDLLAATIEQFAVIQGWKNRELNTIRSLMAAFRRSINAPADGGGAEGLVPFRNGCLRLADRQFISHDPDHGNTWSLPFDYAPSAGCNRIEEFLLDRLGDYTSVMVVRAFCRALLCGERLKCFLEITGPSNTGKSVIANLLQAMVGRQNTAAMTLQRLEDRQQRFETLKLRNRRLALFSECHDYSGCLNNLKAITGGDSIPAEVKGGCHLDITFLGGVVLAGNAPVRASDPSGAVVNRRRSLLVPKVVQAADERQLLEPDGQGGWRGELADELPGLVNWCLAMTAAEARTALARDVRSPARAEAELETLLCSDFLAEWAEHSLAWHEAGRVRVGHAEEDPSQFIYANYLRWLGQQGRNTRPLALRSFKAKLVDLLRDTLGLPLPRGSTNSGEYRMRGVGSVVPGLRLRLGLEEGPGVIRHAFMQRAEMLEAELVGTDPKRVGNGNNPVGKEWKGWNGSETGSHRQNNEEIYSPPIEECRGSSVPPVSSFPQQGSQRFASVPEVSRSDLQAIQPELLGLEPSLVGSGADAFSDDDDPAWGERKELA